MAHFHVPDDRSFHDPGSGFQPWPETPERYRLFIVGDSGHERIGIEVGQQIELQLTAGRSCRIETAQATQARTLAAAHGGDPAHWLARNPELVSVSPAAASSDKQKITLKAVRAGATILSAIDSAGITKATLQVVAGKFENHPGMEVDLIANVCRGSDSLKIHALQRMLNSQGSDIDPKNGDNIFDQKAPSNLHSTFGNMACGLVAKFRGSQIFQESAAVDNDWYRSAFHEPLSRKVLKRSDVKYRPEKIRNVQMAIVAALKSRSPKAVRIGVVDLPKRMTPQNGKLIAYDAGGHTALIVGCNRTGTEFLYIDPWGGGSMMEYKGGIAGNQFPHMCRHLGLMVVANDADRRLRAGDARANILRQSVHTQASFSYAADNYLEVVSVPLAIPR